MQTLKNIAFKILISKHAATSYIKKKKHPTKIFQKLKMI